MSTFIEAIAALTDKAGIRLLGIIRDIAGRDGAVLICNLASDSTDAPINAYIAGHYADIAAAGIEALARAAGCAEIIIYGNDTDTGKIAAAVMALTEIPVTVKSGPASPVLREDTALYHVIDTGVIRTCRAELEYKREFPSYGYGGRPTLVVDGETAYQAGRISAATGAAATKLVAVIDGDTVIREAGVGTASAALLEVYGEFKLALIGGGLGRFIDAAELEAEAVRFDSEWDSVRIIRESDCPVDILARIYRENAELSCGKCVLCRESSWQLSAIFSDITSGRAGRDDTALIDDICPLIQVGALCGFGKSMVRPAISAARVCGDALTEHINKNCASGKCAGLTRYVIDPAVCTGCEECVDSCPEEAIDGKRGYIHIIDEKLCDKCGRCVPACPEGAVKTGKLRTPTRMIRAGQFK